MLEPERQTFGVAPAATTGTPIPPDQANRNIASVYATSISVMALLGHPTATNLAGAQQLSDAMVCALQHDNHRVPIPPAGDGSIALHNAYSSGDLSLFNDQAPPAQGGAGQVRLAGFTGPTNAYYLELDGATGGNNAFAMLALLGAYREFHDSRYLDASVEIGNWVASQLEVVE